MKHIDKFKRNYLIEENLDYESIKEYLIIQIGYKKEDMLGFDGSIVAPDMEQVIHQIEIQLLENLLEGVFEELDNQERND